MLAHKRSDCYFFERAFFFVACGERDCVVARASAICSRRLSIDSASLTSRSRLSLVALSGDLNAVSFAALPDTSDTSGNSGSDAVSSSSLLLSLRTGLSIDLAVAFDTSSVYSGFLKTFPVHHLRLPITVTCDTHWAWFGLATVAIRKASPGCRIRHPRTPTVCSSCSAEAGSAEYPGHRERST